MAFADKKQSTLAMLSKMKNKRSSGGAFKPKVTSDDVETVSTKKDKLTLVVYGKKNHFLMNMVHTLKISYKVEWFEDSESALDYCIDNEIANIIIDMDLPTEEARAIDTYNCVAMANADARVFMVSQNPNSHLLRDFAGKGVVTLGKPINYETVYSYLNE